MITTQNLFESVSADCDLETKIYLKHMEESFVKPYLAWRAQQMLTEAEIDPAILNKMKSGLYAQKPKGKMSPKAVTQVMSPAQMAKFAAAVPNTANSKPVPGFKEKAMKAIAGLKDAASKQKMMDLIKAGISNPAVQQTVLAGITGAAAVGMASLGVPPAVTGGILGGLIGIVKAKAQGGSWKDAAITGIKQGLAGAAAGWAAGATSSAVSTATSSAVDKAVDKIEDVVSTRGSDEKAKEFAFNPEKTPGAPEGGFTKNEPITAGPSVDYSSMSTKELVDQIYADNKDVIGKNPNLIKPGQSFELPNGEDYTVKKGDNLWKIAKMLKAGNLEESLQPQRLDEVTSEQFYDEAKARGYSDAQIKAIFDKFKIELPATMPKGIQASKPVKKPAPAVSGISTGDPALDAELADMMKTQGKDAVVKLLKDVRASLTKAAAEKDPYNVYKSQMRDLAKSATTGKKLPTQLSTKLANELRQDLPRISKGDKDMAATVAQKIMKYAKAGYDLQPAVRSWLTSVQKAEKMLPESDYRMLSELLEEHGLTWGDLGITVRIDESQSGMVFIS